MNSNRLWIIASILVMVLVVAGTAFLGVKPQLDAAAASEADRQAALATNKQLELDLADLKAAFDNMPIAQAAFDELSDVVPDTDLTDDFLRYMDDAEGKAKVRITSALITEPVLYVPSVELAESIDPALDVANFYVMQVSIIAESKGIGPVVKFTGRMQRDPRLFLVYGVNLSVDDDGVYTNTMTGYLFMMRKPDGTFEPIPPSDGSEPTPTPTETPAAPGSTPTPTETPAP